MAVSQTLASIQEAINNLGKPETVSEGERRELLAASKKLTAASQSPLDSALSIILGALAASAIRIANDIKLFDHLIAGKEEGITAIALAEATNSDEIFVTRIMRFLTELGYGKELGIRHYVATALTPTLHSASPLKHAFIHGGLNAQVITQLPDYHRKYGYRTPDDKNETAFQFAIGTKLPYFEWLPTVPEQQDSFNRIMGVSRSERGEPWFDFFPIEERFGSTDPSAPLIVDIGGGLGHDLASLKKQFPSLPGRFILQELPSVINKIEVLDPSIERQTHDAFLPQPVRGARAYYLRTVLHDHPDANVLKMLKEIRDAMTPDSVLLVNENFIPEKDVPLYNAQIDMIMWAMFSSLERTVKQWTDLITKAGFEVVKVWRPTTQTSTATLFEAVKKD